MVANDIFAGDAFVGRLYNEVRTKRGLAYSVGSELRTGMSDQSLWLVWAETNRPSTIEVLAQFEANLTRLHTEFVTDAELDQAKEAYANSAVFDFASPSKIVSRLVKLEYDGLPKDYYQQLRQKILKVSKEDIMAVGRKYLRLDRLKIVAVGSGETLSKELAAFGEVKEVTLQAQDDKSAVITSQLCFDSLQPSPSCAR
jgi:predicted Zn-dependent peptidase